MATKKTTKKPPARTTKQRPVSAPQKASGGEESSTAQEKSDVENSADRTLTPDRRASKDRRRGLERRKTTAPVAVEHRQMQRRAKVNRRRQIDPTTCERDYTLDEIEFMSAMDEYKRASGRMFPTCSEVLEVLRKLGYEKRPQPENGDRPACQLPADPSAEQTPEATAV